jgi:hypothetical protein
MQIFYTSVHPHSMMQQSTVYIAISFFVGKVGVATIHLQYLVSIKNNAYYSLGNLGGGEYFRLYIVKCYYFYCTLMEKLTCCYTVLAYIPLGIQRDVSSLVIRTVSFRTINFPCFLQYSFPVLHIK